jgi:hypothetical protein
MSCCVPVLSALQCPMQRGDEGGVRPALGAQRGWPSGGGVPGLGGGARSLLRLIFEFRCFARLRETMTEVLSAPRRISR